MRTKSIDRRYVENLARVLAALVADFFDGNQSRAAKATAISQTQISDITTLKPSKGVGLPIVLAIRDFTGMSVEELLGLEPPAGHRRPPSIRSARPSEPRWLTSPFAVGAGAAVLDGLADEEDVDAIRERALAERWDWRRVRDEAAAERKRREPPSSKPAGGAFDHLRQKVDAHNAKAKVRSLTSRKIPQR